MSYRLFIDDQALDPGMEEFRSPPKDEMDWRVARSSAAAIATVKKYGIPEYIDFDHDLGILPDGSEDKVMKFLYWLAEVHPDAINEIKGYSIHSKNPEGKLNIKAFMESWIRSQYLI